MENNQTIQKHTAGAIAIGFDYQFYLFMYLTLKLKHGQKIGFEVKDDIHIDFANETTILFQAKHSIQQNKSGEIENLTTSDIDLWKTLSNWTDFIKADATKKEFLEKHHFVLVTNKNANNNQFIEALSLFKKNNEIKNVQFFLNKLAENTQDKTLRKYIKNVISLKQRRLCFFLKKLIIETGTDDIIDKITNRLEEHYRNKEIAIAIFDKLCSNLHKAKYLDIKEQNRFEVSFEDFNKRFGGCFKIATEPQPLPKRDFPISLPEDLESQTFIKQLLDIGEVQSGSKDIIEYTTQMLKFIRNFTYWSDEENFIQLTEAEDFKKNSILIWKNKFKAKYRKIEQKIGSGISMIQLEDDIKTLGIELVEYIREKDLTIPGYLPLGIELSNGHYYALSDNLEIGWHYDWEKKFKS